jgi:hypothetical protein
MKSFDYVKLLGLFYGEEELSSLLSELSLTTKPKIARGDRDVSLVASDAGVELTFTGERALDVKLREYPDGALVLSNVFFHTHADGAIKAYMGELPSPLAKTMNKQQVIASLGQATWTKPDGALLRWDMDKHCKSVKFSDSGEMSLVGVQLPNRFTHKNI